MVNGIVIKLLVAVLSKNIGLIVSMLIFEMIYCQNSSVDRTLIFIELFLNNFKSLSQRQSNWLFFPMALFSEAATTKLIFIIYF